MRFSLYLFLVFFLFNINLFAQQDSIIRRPKVGLVMSGGGAKGFAYIGLLQVLHEINMPIDYIGGSSIGSIMGALYALGYHPDSIEKIVRNENWDDIITNHLDRKYISFEEKYFGEKYLFTVPINDFKVGLGKSLSGSLNVDLLLNRYFSPAYNTDKFEQLPIPFLCIGTDLLTGEQVVLDHGNLARAIRASMAIPGYFSPVLYDGHYLIDGGVVNNYPVNEVKRKGIDIIIGADVQAKQLSSIDELSDMTKILDQIMGYKRFDSFKDALDNTDYYVRFDMPYGMMDFNMYDSIIAIGKQVAYKHYDALKALADSLNNIEPHKLKALTVMPLTNIHIDKIKIDGNAILKEKVVDGYLKEDKNDSVKLSDIEESFRYLSGTKSFDDIHYVLTKEDDANLLTVKFTEADQGSIGASFHYDNDYKGSVLLNLTLRNILKGRGKFFTELVLGQNPRLKSMYIINNGLKPGLGLSFDFYGFEFGTYTDGVKSGIWSMDDYNFSAFIPFALKNDKLLQVGVNYDLFKFDQEVLIDTTNKDAGHFQAFGEVFATINVDNRDKNVFSTKGVLMEIKAKYVFPFNQLFDGEESNNFYTYMKYDTHIPIARNLVFKPSIFMGVSIQDKRRMYKHLYGFGGLNQSNYAETLVPFAGFRFIEKLGTYAAISRFHLQYNFLKNFYGTGMFDIGINEYSKADLNFNHILYGYGVKLSYNSFIGPVEFSIMGSNKAKNALYYLSIGHWF